MNKSLLLITLTSALLLVVGCTPDDDASTAEPESTESAESAESSETSADEAAPADEIEEAEQNEALLPGDEVVVLLAELATLQCGCVDYAASFPDAPTCVENLSMPPPFRRCIQEIGNDTDSAGADYASCYAGALRQQVECAAEASCDMAMMDACEIATSDQNLECQVIAPRLREVFEACLIREGADF